MSTIESSAPPRGMRDFLPADVALRDWATGVILKTYESFGFTRIETPALENINLLRRAEGGENLQLIFEVLKRGDKLERELSSGQPKREGLADLGLRFDLTVPLVRFYAQNQNTLPNPLKAIQIGSVWRAESPQAGRFRQFTQCDIDIFGVKSELAEMELLQATSEALRELGFKHFTIRINDRRILAALSEYCGFDPARVDNVFITLDKLDKIGEEGVRKELVAAGHEELAIDKLLNVVTTLQQTKDFTEARNTLPSELQKNEALEPLANVIKGITEQSSGTYDIKFDPTLVRGMGYYTGQIFEVSCPGYTYSIAGGGRYDKMVGKFSGREVPACGFSIGFERIITVLTDKGFKPPNAAEKIALICNADQDDLTTVFSTARRMRNKGLIVSVQPRKKDMRKQLDGLMMQGFTSFAFFKGNGEELEIKELNQSP
jgi:histidyl-tRNA synthetase